MIEITKIEIYVIFVPFFEVFTQFSSPLSSPSCPQKENNALIFTKTATNARFLIIPDHLTNGELILTSFTTLGLSLMRGGRALNISFFERPLNTGIKKRTSDTLD